MVERGGGAVLVASPLCVLPLHGDANASYIMIMIIMIII